MSDRSFDELHSPEVWTAVAASYDDSIAPIMRPYAVTMLDLLGLTGDTDRPKLLDVAAGTGVVAVEAARRGADVLATDFAPGMVEVIRRQFAAEGLGARAEVMNGQDLDLDDESFDLGTSTFGLMFFADPAAGLRQLHRVLRPGGRVGIATSTRGTTPVHVPVDVAVGGIGRGAGLTLSGHSQLEPTTLRVKIDVVRRQL